MRKSLLQLVALVMTMGPALIQAQTYYPVDISAWYNMAYYPQTGTPAGNVVLGGVPFEFPLSGQNCWDGYAAGEHGSDVRSIQFSVGVLGVTEVHTLLNTDWGTSGGPYAWIEFFGSAGAYYRKDLFANVDIRDHDLSPSWANQIHCHPTEGKSGA